MARKQPEFELQCAVADLLRWAQLPGLYWTALPFGEARPKKKNAKGEWYSPAGERLERMGCRPGAPDLLLIWGGVCFGIELKAGKKVPQSDNQISTAMDWERAGGRYFVCRSYEETVDLLNAIGCIRPVQGHVRFEPRKQGEAA